MTLGPAQLHVGSKEAVDYMIAVNRGNTKIMLPTKMVLSFSYKGDNRRITIPAGTEVSLFENVRGTYNVLSRTNPRRNIVTFFLNPKKEEQICVYANGSLKLSKALRTAMERKSA